MKSVGIVSCNKWLGIIKEDLMLVESLKNNNIDAQLISWEDKTLNYSQFDLLVLRSVWGYQNKIKEFYSWLKYLDYNNIKIINDTNILRNNIDKQKQFNILDSNNIKHVPTYFTDNLDSLKSNINETYRVIKPTISGSGQDTYLINDINNLNEVDLIAKEILTNKKIMLQPFVSEVQDGEYAVVIIDGVVSHVMKRYPGVFSEKKKPQEQEYVPLKVIDKALEIMNINEYKNCSYARVDLVIVNQEPIVMEVELAEPDLLIKYINNEDTKKKSLKMFTESIKKRL